MVVVEQEITEYTSVNVIVEHPTWDIATTYNFDDIIFYEQYYYKCVTDNNTGLIPPDNSSSWLLWEISNSYAQIDLRATTSTIWNADTATNPLDNALISIFPNLSYNFVGLGGVLGSTVLIEVLDDLNNVIYTAGDDIYFREDADWYGYYFGTFNNDTEQGFIYNLPPTTGGSIRVTVSVDSSGTAAVDYMIAGYSQWVGDSLYGASLGFESNSTIEIDDFGITTITRREAAQKMDIDCIFPSQQIQQMKRLARSIIDKTVLFVGDESEDSVYENLLILGYIESWDVILSNPVKITSSFGIREVI